MSTNLLKKISSGNGVDARQEFSFKSVFSENNGFNKEKTSQFSGLWLTRENGFYFPIVSGSFANRKRLWPKSEISDGETGEKWVFSGEFGVLGIL